MSRWKSTASPVAHAAVFMASDWASAMTETIANLILSLDHGRAWGEHTPM